MISVALAGRDAKDEENLGLRYVAAALREANHDVVLHPVLAPRDIESRAAAILRQQPAAVGLALSDAGAATTLLVLAELLRRRGYTGHITAGGALATLLRRELLERHSALDSVIRHAGEEPMLGLCGAIARGEEWTSIAGLTTRDGDGAPAPLPRADWGTRRPVRSAELPTVLGVGIANLIGSRGCLGTCAYCSSHSLRRDEFCDLLRAGHDSSALDALGVGGRRRRPVADFADEVAELYHEKGARVFHLLDDNIVGGDGGQSLAWIEQLSLELERRFVTGGAFSMMINPGSVTERMLAAMQRLGVIRVLLGVEAVTDEGLRLLGRPDTAEVARSAVTLLSEAGIVVLFNSIAVHPEATAASIEAELAALARIQGARIDVNPMVIYPRSAVHDRLCSAGRARAGTFATLYDAADETATRFAALQMRLGTEVPEFQTVAVAAHELELKVALARRLELGLLRPALHREVARTTGAIQELRLRALQSLLTIAREKLEPLAQRSAERALGRRLADHLAAQHSELTRLELKLANGLQMPRSALGQFSTRAVFWSSVVLAAACGGQTGTLGGSASDGTGGSTASPPGSGGTGSSLGGTGSSLGGTGSSLGGGGAISIPGEGIGGAEPDPLITIACGMGMDVAIPEQNRGECSDPQICADASALLYPEAVCGPAEPSSWRVTLDDAGRVDSVEADGVSADVVVCAHQVLSAAQFPCLRNGEVWQYPITSLA